MRRFVCLLLCGACLLGLLPGCGQTETAAPSADVPTADAPEVPETAAPEVPDTADVPESSPAPEVPAVTDPPEEAPAPESEPEPEPEPEETVEPADHVFPDLEAFFGLPLEKDQMYDARGWRWQFQDVTPYDQLEAAAAELLTLLQEPRWQLELVDEQHAVYETGNMNGSDAYYFQYTGTAELTQIKDSLGVRLDHVIVVFYHEAVNDRYTVDIFRSPELEAVDPGSRVSADVGVPETEAAAEDDFWEKCSSCHGSGKCTHCSGKGTVKKFQAGLGRVELDCTLCSRGKCRHCNGTGKD